MCLLRNLRSNLGNLVSSVNGCLSSRDSSSQHQAGTVGLLSLCLKGTHHLLQMGEEKERQLQLQYDCIFLTELYLNACLT